MPQHTPIPWYRQSRYDIGFNVLSDRENLQICHVSGPGHFSDQFNAQLIVTAVNSHEELLEACKGLMRVLGQWPWVYEGCQPVNPPGDWREVRDPAWEAGKAVIANAEGDKP